MKKLKYAFVGSRDWPDDVVPVLKARIDEAMGYVEPGSVVVSGGAKGVDSWSEQAAKDHGFEVHSIKPDWDKHGKAAGMIRNNQIVEAADIVVAFVFNNSKGSMDTVSKARKAGKEVILFKKDAS